MSLNRRQFLTMLAATAATPFTSSALAQGFTQISKQYVSLDQSRPAESTFPLSVASGDPSPNGVMLWTRIAPEQYDGYSPLYFEVAEDRAFEQTVFSGEVKAKRFGPNQDYTVNLDLNGKLGPNRHYYYRFIYRQTASRTGRAKTLPASGAAIEQLKLAVLTCQDFTTGYYNAFHHLADEAVDFVVHLGDFIYEYAKYAGFEDATLRPLTLPSGGDVAMNLADYRYLYRIYRSDPHLQRAMENHTFIITWDDHETADNAYWDYDRDTLGAPFHPYSQETDNIDKLRQLRFDAQRAWIEYVPARVQVDPDAEHPFDYLKLYRRFEFGDLFELFVTDSRTYRTKAPCQDGSTWENYWCYDYENESQTMLGQQQKQWLIDGLTGSQHRWQIWANQTLLAQLAVTSLGRAVAYANYDAWDGYQHERNEIMQAVKDHNKDGLVVLTGDMHTCLNSYLKLDYSNINNWDYDNLVGVELMTPSITSPHLSDTIKHNAGISSSLETLMNGGVQVNNPHIKDFNSNIYGYSILELGRETFDWRVYQVDKLSPTPGAKSLYKRFRYDPKQVWIWQV